MPGRSYKTCWIGSCTRRFYATSSRLAFFAVLDHIRDYHRIFDPNDPVKVLAEIDSDMNSPCTCGCKPMVIPKEREGDFDYDG